MSIVSILFRTGYHNPGAPDEHCAIYLEVLCWTRFESEASGPFLEKVQVLDPSPTAILLKKRKGLNIVQKEYEGGGRSIRKLSNHSPCKIYFNKV
jgi:hypothetical protein